MASAAFRMTSAHDSVAVGILLKHGGDRACRVRGMQVKLLFLNSKRKPLRRSCMSMARNAAFLLKSVLSLHFVIGISTSGHLNPPLHGV